MGIWASAYSLLVIIVLIVVICCFFLGRYLVLHRALRILGRVYLLRVPLLTTIGVVGFCFAAWFGGARSLLGGIFDVGVSGLGLFFVSLTAFLTAWVVMATWRLVRLYGPIRVRDRNAPRAAATFTGGDLGYYAMYYALTLFIALPVILLTISTSTVSGAVLWALGGFVASWLCVVSVVWVQLHLTRRDIARDESPDLFLPTKVFPFNKLFDKAREDDRARQRAESFTNRFRNYPEEMFRGYFTYGPSGADDNRVVRSILPGHVTSSFLLVLTLAAYSSLGVVKFWRLGDTSFIPTLCYILLLAALFCWALSGLAFFWDRYRIPVLIPVALWLAFTSILPWSDYYYPLEPHKATPDEIALSTGNVTTGNEKSSDESIIVVAANGGGIQAAAWTARVLTGLEEECRRDEQCDEQFDEKIRLVSSVSGGSVGAMYFVNEYKHGRIDPSAKLNGIVERTEGSSLDEIAWGVLYPDLLHTILSAPIPFFGWDRGRALEEAWLRQDIPWKERAGIQEGLSEWREDAEAGDRPAVIFNTTIAESGQRLPLASADMPEGTPGRITYDKLLTENEERDIKIVTATRLSASFPYVSPAARAADVEGGASHIVDGGYYDNYGISSLVEWLDQELTDHKEIKRVLVIEIRGAPSGPSYTFEDAENCEAKSTEAPDRKSKQGWLFQFVAPARTVLNVRETGQRAHNDFELDLLVDKWDRTGKKEEEGKHRVPITRALFEFDHADTPLSWHLTEKNKQKIEENWQEEINSESNSCAGWEKVETFLSKDKGGE